MSHFFGSMVGEKGKAVNMRGGKHDGLAAIAQGWDVGVVVNCHYNEDLKRDECTIGVTDGSIGKQYEVLGMIHNKKGRLRIKLGEQPSVWE